MAQAISSRSVNPVDAAVDPFANGGNRVFIFLWPPAEFPASSADGPGSQTDRRYLKIAVSQLSFFHNDSPFDLPFFRSWRPCPAFANVCQNTSSSRTFTPAGLLFSNV